MDLKEKFEQARKNSKDAYMFGMLGCGFAGATTKFLAEGNYEESIGLGLISLGAIIASSFKARRSDKAFEEVEKVVLQSPPQSKRLPNPGPKTH